VARVGEGERETAKVCVWGEGGGARERGRARESEREREKPCCTPSLHSEPDRQALIDDCALYDAEGLTEITLKWNAVTHVDSARRSAFDDVNSADAGCTFKDRGPARNTRVI
jgi:hypothetical protein